MKIKIIIHEAEEGGFWAEVPTIPGCATPVLPANLGRKMLGKLGTHFPEIAVFDKLLKLTDKL